MIDFVLQDPREKVFCLSDKRMPLPIETLEGNSTMPGNVAAQVRNRKATLESFDHLVAYWCEDGVEQHDHVA